MMQAVFTYPDAYKYYPEYKAHSGQTVIVLRLLEDGVEYDREDGEPMFEVIADDGWTGHVWGSELS